MVADPNHTNDIADRHDRQAAPGTLERVRALVNSWDVEAGTDELTTPDGAHAWLVEKHLLAAADPPLDHPAWERLIAVREALRALLRVNAGADPDPEAARLLDREAERAGLRIRFDDAGTAGLEPATSGLDAALAHLFAAVRTAQVDGSWPLLKACGNPSCAWAFFDRSKNRSGVWCSMASCGNRMKARAYRERRAQGG